jgi:hypothetical protein
VSRIHLVFDTSAVRAYSQTVDVGETIREVEHNAAAFAIPVACLVEAIAAVGPDVVAPMLESKAAVILGIEPADWPALAATRDLLGAFDVACAALAADLHDCHVLTAQPWWYAPFGDDPPVIAIG